MTGARIPRQALPGDEVLDALERDRLARAVEALVAQLHEQAVAVARVEVKLDAALAGQEDHEKRLRKVERALWRVSLPAGGAAAALVETLTHLLTNR